MATRLDKPLKRELTIDGRPFVLVISPQGLKLTLKGHRKGQELRWQSLVSGEAALAVALNASLGQFSSPRAAAAAGSARTAAGAAPAPQATTARRAAASTSSSGRRAARRARKAAR